MKRFLILLSCSGILLSGAELAGVRSVYLLPMSRGLDQYLANRLTNNHVFTVVTDPKMADAIFTDRIGAPFEEQLKDITTPAHKAPAAPKSGDEKGAASAGDNPEPRADVPTDTAAASTIEALATLKTPPSTMSRAKGTVFLVDPKSREVIWSAYDVPKDSSSEQLDRTASDIVSRLKRELKKK